jgi:hypothetical protein
MPPMLKSTTKLDIDKEADIDSTYSLICACDCSLQMRGIASTSGAIDLCGSKGIISERRWHGFKRVGQL